MNTDYNHIEAAIKVAYELANDTKHGVVCYNATNKQFTSRFQNTVIPPGYEKLTLRQIVDFVAIRMNEATADKQTLQQCQKHMALMGQHKVNNAQYGQTLCGSIRELLSKLQNLILGYGFQTSAELAAALAVKLGALPVARLSGEPTPAQQPLSSNPSNVNGQPSSNSAALTGEPAAKVPAKKDPNAKEDAPNGPDVSSSGPTTTPPALKASGSEEETKAAAAGSPSPSSSTPPTNSSNGTGSAASVNTPALPPTLSPPSNTAHRSSNSSSSMYGSKKVKTSGKGHSPTERAVAQATLPPPLEKVEWMKKDMFGMFVDDAVRKRDLVWDSSMKEQFKTLLNDFQGWLSECSMLHIGKTITNVSFGTIKRLAPQKFEFTLKHAAPSAGKEGCKVAGIDFKCNPDQMAIMLTYFTSVQGVGMTRIATDVEYPFVEAK